MEVDSYTLIIRMPPTSMDAPSEEKKMFGFMIYLSRLSVYGMQRGGVHARVCIWSTGGLIIYRHNHITARETCPSATVSTINPT